MSAKKLENLLKSGTSGTLHRIIQTAADMDSLTSRLRAALPEEIAAHLVAASLRDDGVLTVICSTSAWASRIRFDSDTLLAAAEDAGFKANAIRVSVSQG